MIPLPQTNNRGLGMTDWDYIVIGGGSAGAVMAARLSEIPANRVLLLEAGRDTPPGNEGDEVRDTFYRAVSNLDSGQPAKAITDLTDLVE